MKLCTREVVELSGGGMDHHSALRADPILVRVDTELFRLLLYNQYLIVCLKYIHTYIVPSKINSKRVVDFVAYAESIKDLKK